MKKLLLGFLIVLPVFTYANSKPLDNEVAKDIEILCKSAYEFAFKQTKAINIIDNTETSITQQSQLDIDKYKSIEKYKNLDNSQFKNYLVNIEMEADVNDHEIGNQIQAVGSCLIGVVGNDIVFVTSQLPIFADKEFLGVMPSSIVDTLLNTKIDDLGVTSDKIQMIINSK